MMRQCMLFILSLLLLQCSSRNENLEIEVFVAMRGGGSDFIWTQARAAALPDGVGSYRGLMTMSQKLKSGDDVYYDLYQA